MRVAPPGVWYISVAAVAVAGSDAHVAHARGGHLRVMGRGGAAAAEAGRGGGGGRGGGRGRGGDGHGLQQPLAQVLVSPAAR